MAKTPEGASKKSERWKNAAWVVGGVAVGALVGFEAASISL